MGKDETSNGYGWCAMAVIQFGAGLRDLPSRELSSHRASLHPAVSARLATTPKLTGGHDVARGPDQVDGFAFRPGRISQLLLGIHWCGPKLRVEC